MFIFNEQPWTFWPSGDCCRGSCAFCSGRCDSGSRSAESDNSKASRDAPQGMASLRTGCGPSDYRLRELLLVRKTQRNRRIHDCQVDEHFYHRCYCIRVCGKEVLAFTDKMDILGSIMRADCRTLCTSLAAPLAARWLFLASSGRWHSGVGLCYFCVGLAFDPHGNLTKPESW